MGLARECGVIKERGGSFGLGLFEVSSEALEEVGAFTIEVFQLGFFAGDFSIEASQDVGFVDENVVSAGGDFDFGGLGVDCGEFELTGIVVCDVTNGDSGELVEAIESDDYTVVGGVTVAVAFDKDFDFVAHTVLCDLFSRAEVDLEFGAVDFNDAGVGHSGVWFVVEVGLIVDEEVFVRFGSDNPGPADDFSFFEEILCVLAGVFDLVEICLSDREWFVHGTKCHCVLSLCCLGANWLLEIW